MAGQDHNHIPAWAWVVPLLALLMLAAKAAGLLPASAAPVLVLAAVLLFASVFAAVHHAELLALKFGEPFGSILLAVSVTVIEVAMIVSIFLSDMPGGETVARDTVFAAFMIVLNGVVGLSLVLGAGRYREQSFRLDGASASLAVLGTLATLALVLPNHTIAVLGPVYSNVQLLFIGGVSLVLYAVFVLVQTVLHRDYFLDAVADGQQIAASVRPTMQVTLASGGLLILSLSAVVLLAKILSYPLDHAVEVAGLPQTVVGVVIALIVLMPEGLASLRASLQNRLQNSINLALGSAIASIGLTIPTVALVSVLAGERLILGLSNENTVLLVLTLFVCTLTLGTGRTTVLQGALHLVIFSVFLLLSAIP